MADAPRAVVLAAGKGTRMKSVRPKVLHEVAGRPMLAWVLDAAREAGCAELVVVVGHGADEVRAAVEARDVRFVVQQEQRGTGHALACARDLVPADSVMLVLSGDVPLLRPATLAGLLDAARESWGALAVARHDDPGSLGRVVVESDGSLERIVEAADATAEELAIDLVNAGIYALPAGDTFARLDRLGTDNAKGELYLTDALGGAAADGERVVPVELEDPGEAFGANDRLDLARIHRTFLDRKLAALAEEGVTVLEPERTVIEPQVEIGADTVIHPGVSLTGRTTIGAGSVIEQGCWVRSSTLGAGVTLLPYSVLEGAAVEADCRIGPFARLRPGAQLDSDARVGNFVEVKNARLGPGVKAGHLAYLGDAEIGAGTNIGAGTITCNYDGVEKHRTTIGRDVFVGSDTMLVAPVELGDEASTAAGSVIHKDVPEGALGVARTRQRNIEGWAERSRRKRDERD